MQHGLRLITTERKWGWSDGTFSQSASVHSSPPEPPRALSAGTTACQPGISGLATLPALQVDGLELMTDPLVRLLESPRDLGQAEVALPSQRIAPKVLRDLFQAPPAGTAGDLPYPGLHRVLARIGHTGGTPGGFEPLLGWSQQVDGWAAGGPESVVFLPCSCLFFELEGVDWAELSLSQENRGGSCRPAGACGWARSACGPSPTGARSARPGEHCEPGPTRSPRRF